jgi:hypothetical protein
MIYRFPSNLPASPDCLASHVANSSRVKMENDNDISVGPIGISGQASRPTND